MGKWITRKGILQIYNGSEYFIPDPQDIYEAVFEHACPWDKWSIEDCKYTLGLNFSRYPVTIRLVIMDSHSDGIPELKFEVQTQEGYSEFMYDAVLKAGHVVLQNVWYPIEPTDIQELENFIANNDGLKDGLVTDFRSLLELKRNARFDYAIVRDDTNYEAFSALKYLPLSEGNPLGIEANLYPYQIEGWNWLRFLISQGIGALLADEMGLGKTLQVISAIVDPGQNESLFPALIVAPGSLLENWRREFKKFAPNVMVLKHQGQNRTGSPKDLEEFDVVITSYDIVNRDLSLLKMFNWKIVVSDESQSIKNPKALRTKSIKQLPRQVSLAMTGTPVENRLEDLWSVMNFTVPDYLGTLNKFKSLFQDKIEAAERLEPLVSPLILRRRVANVAHDLPDRIDIPLVLEFTDEEADEYERIRQRITKEYGKAATLVSLTNLRQFCSHPVLLSDQPANFPVAEFTKIECLEDILEEIFFQQEKVLIFTSYNKMADIIARIIKSDYGIFAKCLDGRLPINDRQPLLDCFSAVQGAAALVLNPRAGGSGLNIIAANHVIHYNLEWNPALEDQASARAHRHGQTRPVTVHRLFFADTVEETVNDRIMRKRLISEAAVVGVEGKDSDYDDIISALERTPARRNVK